jgi:hypothetical protein
VTADAQLAAERRGAPWAAAAALAAAVLFTAQTFVVQAVVLEGRPDTDRGVLRALHEHSGELIVSAVLQALGALALLVVFRYLLDATRARRPELPAPLAWLVYGGPLLYALGGLVGVFDRLDVADRFADGAFTEKRADDLLDSPSALTIGISLAGTLALALLFVLVSMNAMRAGLLSRFTGILGVIVGALMVLPLVPGGSLVIQIFWLGALAALFLNRWPGGRGPAWESGRAEPWPSAAERRQAVAEPPAPAEPEPEAAPARRSSRKRRRKRR